MPPKSSSTDVTIDGRQLKLSNLDKVLYPEAGFTKGQVIDYYVRVSDAILPHLRGRPLTLKRYPNGVDAPFFYEKQCPSHRPDWVHTEPIPSERTSGKTINYCVVDDRPTLVWVANLYMNLYANFRLDIKKERVEIKQIEKQVKEPEPQKPRIERPAA